MKYSADILATMACRDYDNAQDDDGGWRVEHLWINEDGKYTTCDSDGNHEPFDGRGIRAFYRDTDKSWKEYADWVYAFGSDPLGNYFVKPTITEKQRWTANARMWIGTYKHGLAVESFERGGKKILPPDAPKEVRDYFMLKNVSGRWCIDGVTSFKQINLKPGRKICAMVEFVRPNPDYGKQLREVIDNHRKQVESNE